MKETLLKEIKFYIKYAFKMTLPKRILTNAQGRAQGLVDAGKALGLFTEAEANELYSQINNAAMENQSFLIKKKHTPFIPLTAARGEAAGK